MFGFLTGLAGLFAGWSVLIFGFGCMEGKAVFAAGAIVPDVGEAAGRGLFEFAEPPRLAFTAVFAFAGIIT